MIKARNSEGQYVEPKAVWYKAGDTYEKVTKVYTNPQETTILQSQSTKDDYVKILTNLRSKIEIMEGAINGTGKEQFDANTIDKFRDELPIIKLQEEIFSTELLAVTQDSAVQNFVYNFQSQFEKPRATIDKMIATMGENMENYTIIELTAQNGIGVDPQSVMFSKISTRTTEKVAPYVFTLNKKYYRIVDSSYTPEEKTELINKIESLLGPQHENGVIRYTLNQKMGLDTIINFLQNILHSIKTLSTNAELIKTRFYGNLKDTQTFNTKLDELEAIYDGTDTTHTSSRSYVTKTLNTVLNEELFLSNDKLGTRHLGVSKCIINGSSYTNRKHIPNLDRFNLLKNWKVNNPTFIDNAIASGDITQTEADIFEKQYALEKSIIGKHGTLINITLDYENLLAILLDQKELSLSSKVAEIKKVQETNHTFWVEPIKAITETPTNSVNNWVESYKGGGAYSFGVSELFDLDTVQPNIISWFQSAIYQMELAVSFDTEHKHIISIKDAKRTEWGLELILDTEHPKIVTQLENKTGILDYSGALDFETNHHNNISNVESSLYTQPLQIDLGVDHPSQIVQFMNTRRNININDLFVISSDYWKYSLMIRQVNQPNLSINSVLNNHLDNNIVNQEFIVKQKSQPLNFDLGVSFKENNGHRDFIVIQSSLTLNSSSLAHTTRENKSGDNDYIVIQSPRALSYDFTNLTEVTSNTVNTVSTHPIQKQQHPDYTQDPLDTTKTYQPYVVNDFVLDGGTIRDTVQEIYRHKLMREKAHSNLGIKSDPLYMSIQEGLVILEKENGLSSNQSEKEYIVHMTALNSVGSNETSVYQQLRRTPVSNNSEKEYYIHQTSSATIKQNEFVTSEK